MRTYGRAVSVVALVTLGLVASIPLAAGLREKTSAADGTQFGFTPQSCEQQTPGRVAVLGRIVGGSGSGGAAIAGYVAKAAIKGSSDQALVVLARADGTSIDDPTDLTLPGIADIGDLLTQSQDPALRSCHLRLGDRPLAAAFAARGVDALVAGGIVSKADANGDGAVYLLADDPTDPSRLIFTLVISQPNRPLDPGAQQRYAAEIDRATGEVLAVGAAGWQAAS
jgi:hypothetical protein